MTQLALSQQQVNLFVDIFLLGNELNASEDTSAVVRLIKHVRPNEYNLVIVEAWQLIREQKFFSARQLLEDADAAHPKQAMLKTGGKNLSKIAMNAVMDALPKPSDFLPPSMQMAMAANRLAA